MSRHTCVVLGYGLVGRACLDAVVDIGLEPAAVYTHSQGLDSWQTGLAPDAARLGVPCTVDADWSLPQETERLARLAPDILLSFYYRDVLPAAALAAARHGGLNLHGSILPWYRGRAPVNWVVLHGETESGATLHVMEARPDRGPVLGIERFGIEPHETAWDVLLKVRDSGVKLVRSCILPFLSGHLQPVPQQPGGSTFSRRKPADGRIDWSWPADRIIDLVRAVTRPYPGAFTDMETDDGEIRRLFVWWARIVDIPAGPAGTVRWESGRLYVAAGDRTLEIVDWSIEGLPAP